MYCVAERTDAISLIALRRKRLITDQELEIGSRHEEPQRIQHVEYMNRQQKKHEVEQTKTANVHVDHDTYVYTNDCDTFCNRLWWVNNF